MKAITEKKDPNLVEKVKVVKEAGTVCKSALDTNAKNTKEYLDTLQEILKTNTNISKNFKEFAQKEIDAYMIGLNNATNDEERKPIYEEIKKLHEDVKRMEEKELEESADIKEKATKEAECNKELVCNVLKGFVAGALFVLSLKIGLKEAPNMINKLIDKK